MSQSLEFAQRIKEKRQELNISREELANQTRVPLTFIVALEEGRQDELPDEAYSNGFVRIISKHLGIKPPNLAATEIQLQTNINTRLFHTHKRKRLVLPTKKNTFRLISVSLLLLPIAASVVVLVLGGKSWFVATPDVHTSAESTSDMANIADTPAIAEQQIPATERQTQTAEQQVKITVHMPTEVQIRIDGNQRTKEILLPRVHTFNFKDESEFILSDTSAVTVSFNGEVISDIERLGKRRTIVFRSTESEYANY